MKGHTNHVHSEAAQVHCCQGWPERAATVPSHQYYLKQGFKPEHWNLSKEDRPASEHGQKSPDQGTLAWTSRLSQHRVLTSTYARSS